MTSLQRCPQCDHKNNSDATHCQACGMLLLRTCSHCTIDNPLWARYCMSCGKPLRHNTQETMTGCAERRQITVMFCDLVNSTGLSEQLDPEDMREIFISYREACATAINHMEGCIHQFLGDGVLAFFGYPKAHEDDAHRAVNAALEIVDLIAERSQTIRSRFGVSLALRIGIHTGLVVAGDIVAGVSTQEQTIVGETPNVAARIQAEALANQIVVSQATQKLISEAFHLRYLGATLFKGLSRKVRLYAVVRANRACNRFEFSLSKEGSMISRVAESAFLRQHWINVTQGMGCAVLISGVAGIGKSHLVHDLGAWVNVEAPATVIQMQCSAFHENTPLYPVQMFLLHGQSLVSVQEDGLENIKSIECFLNALQLPLVPGVALLSDLLNVQLQAPYQLPDLSPERLRMVRLELLKNILKNMARQKPVLLSIEDLHWIDPSTLQWLELLLSDIENSPLFVVLTTRPEFNLPKTFPVEQLSLSRFNHADSRELMYYYDSERILSEATVTHLLEKSDGIPLYIEELTKAVIANIKSSKKALSDNYIPDSLQASLLARLDKLSHTKELAQIAAIIGREFDQDIIQAVSELPHEKVKQYLQDLVKAEILFVRSRSESDYSDHVVYVFKHALIQSAAYQTLLKTTRRYFHSKIAKVLVDRFPDVAKLHPEWVAQHYSEGGLPEPAISYWLLAGRHAFVRSNNQEAIVHFRKGLALISKLSNQVQKNSLELALLSALGPALIATQGFADEQVGALYARASELSALVGFSAQSAPALWGLWVFCLVRSRLSEAGCYAQELLEIGQRSSDKSILIEGHWTLGDTQFWRGELSSAYLHLQQAIEMYNMDEHWHNAFVYGQDPGVSAYCYQSCVFLHMGYLDQALTAIKAARVLANRLNHPFSVGWSLGFETLLWVWLGETEKALGSANETIRFCEEQVQPFWLYAVLQLKGWVLSTTGQYEEGLTLLQEGLAAYRGIGSMVVLPDFLALQAEVLFIGGCYREALECVREGLYLAEQHQECIAISELLRIKAVILSQSEPFETAQSCFIKALQYARSLGAKLRELRVQISYSEYLIVQGEYRAAQEGLGSIYSCFREGHQSRWLQQAETLLANLSSQTVKVDAAVIS